MLKFFLISSLVFGQDSLRLDSTNTESIIFVNKNIDNFQIERISYRHEQGFFCDFEDKINKKNKIRLNLGVGEQ